MRMTFGGPATGADKVRVVFDMTFPDRNQGGSGVYARALLAAFRGREDVQVSEVRSLRPGVPRTTWWLARGAAAKIAASRARLSARLVFPAVSGLDANDLEFGGQI